MQRKTKFNVGCGTRGIGLALLALILALGCTDGPLPVAPGLALAEEEATVECDSMTIEQACTLLEESGVLEYLEAQGRTDEQLVEDAKLICFGVILPNPNP